MPRLRNIGAMSFLISVSCMHTENFAFNRDITSNAGKVKIIMQLICVYVNVKYVRYRVNITAVETQ
jgi:hypothetical protein